MGAGYLQVSTTLAGEALPVGDAKVAVMTSDGNLLYRMTTGPEGSTPPVALPAPSAENTLNPNAGAYYDTYDVYVEKPGYSSQIFNGVKIWGDENALLPVNMLPQIGGAGTAEYDLKPHALSQYGYYEREGGEDFPQEDGYSSGGLTRGASTRILPDVVFPEYITVHLCKKDESCQNKTVPFVDYIKNVCTNEIYDTWPTEAIKANIYAQTSLALNRIYTEWYPSQG